MKFSALALATISILFNVSEGRRTLSAAAIERQLNSLDKSSFLQHARSLENEEEGNFDLTGQYSVRFNSCVSIELDEEEANEGNRNQNSYQNNEYYENAVAVKEMLIVDLVSSDSSVATQEVAMDIGTFVDAIGRMVYEQVESYCAVCQEIEDTCLSQANGSTSWLSQHNSKYYDAEQGTTIEYVDCDTCVLYNCIGNDEGNRKLNEDGEYDMEAAFEYLEELSQCQAFSVSYQNSEYSEHNDNQDYNHDEDQEQNSQSLYIGYMCSEYGAGIELSFFLDEDCTLATSEIDVNENIPENSMAGQYLQVSQNLINGIFENSFSCDNIQFASPFENQGNNNNSSWYNFQYYGNNAEVDADENIPTANEYCQSIFEAENTMAIECQGMSSVASGNWMSWMNRDNAQNETAYDEEEEEAQYDEDDICAAIRSTSKSAWIFRQNNNQNNNFYSSNNGDENNDQQNSGYDYRSFGKYNEENRVAAQPSSFGTILMYIGVAAAVIAGAVYFTQKKKESNEAKKQSLILEGDAGDYKAEGEIA